MRIAFSCPGDGAHSGIQALFNSADEQLAWSRELQAFLSFLRCAG